MQTPIEPDLYVIDKEKLSKVIRRTQQLKCAVQIMEKRLVELGQLEGPYEPITKEEDRFILSMQNVEKIVDELCGEDGDWISIFRLVEDDDEPSKDS